jgi:hypothetical protein
MKSRLPAAGAALVLVLCALTGIANPASGAVRRAPWCGNAALRASYRYSDAGAGHVWGFIVLRNTSARACRTGGFAGVSYVGDGNGTRIGAPADRTGTPRTYLLEPGQRVRSLLQETRAANYPAGRCRPHAVDGFRVYVPNATRAQFVAHRTTGCLNTNVHLLTERALRRP